MSKETIVQDLTKALEDAAPTNLPASTRGIPGGAIDWEKFAEAIVGAMEDLLGDRRKEDYVEAESEVIDDGQELTRVAE